MHYKFYSTEDFIQDELFQQWVFSPNAERDQYWAAFLQHYPMQREKVEEARAFLLAMDFERTVPESTVQIIRQNFNERIDDLEFNEKPNPQAKKTSGEAGGKTSWFRGVYRVAASFLLVALVAGYFIIQKDIPLNVYHALTLEEQKTPQGKQRHLTLEDGTQVWLNADSELQYPKTFDGKKTREVYLQGEAFFDVAESKEKAFIVHTSDLAITVLGTAFNVKSYTDDPVVETTLVRGKVVIASDSKDSLRQLTLLPNQQALFRKDSRVLALEDEVNTEKYTAWKNGWMIFDDKPFSYIKETLERWYDVRITIEDENSMACTFSAKFKDKTLYEVLEIFKNTEAINYRIDGKAVFIYGRLCQYNSN